MPSSSTSPRLGAMDYGSATKGLIHPIKPEHMMANEHSWEMDPDKLPQKLELSTAAMELLQTRAQQISRSEDELIPEILDQALQRQQG